MCFYEIFFFINLLRNMDSKVGRDPSFFLFFLYTSAVVSGPFLCRLSLNVRLCDLLSYDSFLYLFFLLLLMRDFMLYTSFNA